MPAIIGSTVAITNTHMLILVFFNLNKLCIHFLSSSAILLLQAHKLYCRHTQTQSHAAEQVST